MNNDFSSGSTTNAGSSVFACFIGSLEDAPLAESWQFIAQKNLIANIHLPWIDNVFQTHIFCQKPSI